MKLSVKRTDFKLYYAILCCWKKKKEKEKKNEVEIIPFSCG